MIVKIQRALNDGDMALIYNKSRTVMLQGEATPEVKEALGADLKAYFKAQVSGTAIKLGKRMSAQPW